MAWKVDFHDGVEDEILSMPPKKGIELARERMREVK